MTTDGVDVIGGVDTHGHTHHAAAISEANGKLLGDKKFPATAAGYRQLLLWLLSFGRVVKVGVEGTGSYGAGLFRYLHAEHIPVIEVNRPNRQGRHLHGKSDPIDAIAAARAVLAETATALPKLRSGPVEAIRLLRTARASAMKARKAAINQMHSVLVGAPDELRASMTGLNRGALVGHCARLRADVSRIGEPSAAAKIVLRRLARRVQLLDGEIAETDEQMADLVAQTAPAISAISGVGTQATAQLLMTAGDNPQRIGSEAALARLCGTAPIPASSGTTTRYRLHRGADRQANSAIYLIVVNRLRWHPATSAYVQRRTAEGKTKKEIIRCLKRAVVREIYTALRADLAPHDSKAPGTKDQQTAA